MMYDSVLHAENRIEKYKYSDVVNNNMAVKYIPDDIISRISVLMNGDAESIQVFIKKALEEGLKNEEKRSES